MVASADGAASLDGASAGLSSEADRQVFMLLRALSDVILVGAGTVRAEGYGPARTRSSGPTCGTAGPRLPRSRWSARGWTWTRTSRAVHRGRAGRPHHRHHLRPGAADRRAGLARHADVITAGEEAIDLNAAVRALADRGHRRMLTEGGPHLLGQLPEAGLLDELCLTIGPLLAGPGASRIVTGHPLPARRCP